MVELNEDNSKKSTSIFSNSNALKENMPMSILVYSHMVILYLSIRGSIFFEDLNIINFPDQYSQIYTNYQVNKEKKIKRLI